MDPGVLSWWGFCLTGYKSYILCSESNVINYLLTEVDPGVLLFFHGGDFVIRVISRKFSGPRAILLVTDRACLSRTWKISDCLFCSGFAALSWYCS